MKIPKLMILKKKKLRASTARRAIAVSDEADYEEMSEPNMKLSRALLIVLVLHVVAVAGIIAFNSIKSRQGAFPQRSTSTGAVKNDAADPASKPQPGPTTMNSAVAPAREEIKAALPVSKGPAKEETAKPALPVNAAPAGENFYVVAKGDNPVKIAKKLKVSESELLAVNNIDDPRKLQIGQKLIVPTKKTASKKNSKSATD